MTRNNIQELCKSVLNIEDQQDVTIQILENDSSPPYITKDRGSLTNPNSIFIIVGKEWLINKYMTIITGQINRHMYNFTRDGYVTYYGDQS